ncbi:MAG: hypothetical protein VX464_11670 [Pseudomonadota bacterium]|nr:hypothetical protein [Pseudomonadota bacterium]
MALIADHETNSNFTFEKAYCYVRSYTVDRLNLAVHIQTVSWVNKETRDQFKAALAGYAEAVREAKAFADKANALGMPKDLAEKNGYELQSEECRIRATRFERTIGKLQCIENSGKDWRAPIEAVSKDGEVTVAAIYEWLATQMDAANG